MNRNVPASSPVAGFTLVEVMVSMVVLVLLVVMVTQLTNGATITTTNSGKHMDADSQARMVFDRMAEDFGTMVKRADVDYIFAKQGGNDAMFFYSEAPAYYDSAQTTSARNSVALVGYRINSNLQLERMAKGLAWDGRANTSQAGGAMSLVYPGGSATPDPASTLDGNWSTIGTYAGTSSGAYSDGVDTDYHVLGDQVYRLEISFLLNDGTTSTIPVTQPAGVLNSMSESGPPLTTSGSSGGYSQGSRWYDTTNSRGYVCTNAATGATAWSPIGIQDVAAVIVAVAVLDTKSRKIVANSNQMVNALVDPRATDLSANPPALMARTWLSAVTSTGFAAGSGMPQAAASQVRIYQRYFYLDCFNFQ